MKGAGKSKVHKQKTLYWFGSNGIGGLLQIFHSQLETRRRLNGWMELSRGLRKLRLDLDLSSKEGGGKEEGGLLIQIQRLQHPCGHSGP